jgi:hypothetical protein
MPTQPSQLQHHPTKSQNHVKTMSDQLSQTFSISCHNDMLSCSWASLQTAKAHFFLITLQRFAHFLHYRFCHKITQNRWTHSVLELGAPPKKRYWSFIRRILKPKSRFKGSWWQSCFSVYSTAVPLKWTDEWRSRNAPANPAMILEHISASDGFPVKMHLPQISLRRALHLLQNFKLSMSEQSSLEVISATCCILTEYYSGGLHCWVPFIFLI